MSRLLEITAANFQHFLDGILEIEKLSFPSPWSLNAFKDEIRNPISHLWALAGDDALTGYLCFWMFDSEIQLINIAVHPLKRRKGYGHHLLTKLIGTGISKGIEYIWLEVRVSNTPARRLYQKLGFKEIGRRPRYYTDTNEDAIVMSLGLSKEQFGHFASD
jgi:ribosomal-protein-alanine N-acetyltransferase